MGVISFLEVFDIAVMSLFLGYLFHDVVFPRHRAVLVDPELTYKHGFDWKSFWYATAALAPSVILHELAHKFVAMGYGMEATFHAFYANSFTFLLGIFAIASKVFNFGFFLLVPGFVSIRGTGTPLEFGLIAFAGPAVHLILWLGSMLVLKVHKKLSSTQKVMVILVKQINMFLFIFNMLPIPGFDGFSVYSNILRGLGG
ncbi:hypothetical protein CMO92_03750 [Candidatus Woesearchaeota archaeon]|nr:hypothetical protein [Candidatus Woesearchaeota archaeon]